jgi:transposase-like protein
LVKAVQKHFQVIAWQRCRVHLTRNILGIYSLRYRKAITEQVKLTLQAPDKEETRGRLNSF